MSETQAPKFSCPNCDRKYVWKEQLAGKKAKCKCGGMIDVPTSIAAAAPAEDDMYGFADDAAPAVPRKVLKVATIAPAAAVPPAGAKPSRTLAYQSPTSKKADRFSTDTLLDMNRDVYVPIGLLIAGVILYVSYFAVHYRLHGAGIAMTSVGLFIMTAFKALLMIGFALVMAGPLGVSFGGLWTAMLKLAAIAVFCDGATTWVDALVTKSTGGIGGGGFMSFGVISYPIALGLYWVLLIYLFSMDSGDSWIVVILLSVFDRLVKWVIVMLLLTVVLNWSGVAAPAITGASQKMAASSDPSVANYQDLKDREALIEARKYIADGHRSDLSKPVEDWYANGCTNIWFAMSHPDINGRRDADNLLLELPTDKAARTKCFDVMKKYYDDQQIGYDPSEVKDDGHAYLEVQMR